MKKLISAVLAALERGESVTLCSVLSSHGSAPRSAGAHMAVFAGGRSLGSVGGGWVEYSCQQQAAALAPGSGGFVRSFDLSEKNGMLCGGSLDILFLPLSAGDLPLLSRLPALFDESPDSWLMYYKEGSAWCWDVFCPPRGFLGRASVPEETLSPLLLSCSASDGRLYLQPLTRRHMVWVFGGGHVAQALVPLLQSLEFRVTVYEDRADYCTPSLFPGAGLLTAPFTAIEANAAPAAPDYAVVMTRGHDSDFIVLEQLLRLDLAYVGVMGSRKKKAAMREKLLTAGISLSAVDSLHSPIGLPIGASSPMEIAVSIAAELVAQRAAANKSIE